MQFRRKSKAEISINLAPLIDVIFLLVIFFAVSTTFLETAGLQLELPESSSTAKREIEDITVFLSADGTEHGAVVEIMDLIRDSGAEVMTIAARSAGSD